MSIKSSPCYVCGWNETSKSSGIERLAFFNLYVRQICFSERPDLGLDLFLRLFGRRDLDVVEVAERLVGWERELLARLVDALLALLDLLGGRLPRGGAERARREVDAELLRSAEQLVVLLAHL